MKNLALLIIAICLFISCKKEDPIPTQLLKSTDLESDLSAWDNYGSTVYGFNFNPTCTNEESFSPTHSLILNCETADSINWHCWSQLYTGKMPFGEDLTLSQKIKAVNLTGLGVFIKIVAFDGVNKYALQTATSEGLTGTFNWTEYSITLPDLSKAVTSIYVTMYYPPKTTGKVYFDDITLTHK